MKQKSINLLALACFIFVSLLSTAQPVSKSSDEAILTDIPPANIKDIFKALNQNI